MLMLKSIGRWLEDGYLEKKKNLGVCLRLLIVEGSSVHILSQFIIVISWPETGSSVSSLGPPSSSCQYPQWCRRTLSLVCFWPYFFAILWEGKRWGPGQRTSLDPLFLHQLWSFNCSICWKWVSFSKIYIFWYITSNYPAMQFVLSVIPFAQIEAFSYQPSLGDGLVPTTWTQIFLPSLNQMVASVLFLFSGSVLLCHLLFPPLLLCLS